ncbi:MAG: hemin uptake protein HemP [Gammaproteobacteria bacterium]|nr:hemin uptake protein HemP [Gammaproteobacteria bacterium]
MITPAPNPPDTLPMQIESKTLFRGTREICIQHAGHQYRLRITRSGKLILTK